MKILQQESKKLKLNATNIKSQLIDSNKKLIQLKKSKKSFIRKESERKNRIDEESRIEAPFRSFGRSIGNVASKIAKAPMSFFDKIKEFFGLILAGIILNNLPSIIESIKQFFDNNPWIISGTKFVLESIGKGILGIIDIVNFFTESKQKNTERNLKETRDELSTLNGEQDKLLRDIDTETRRANLDSQEESSDTTPIESPEPSTQPELTPNSPKSAPISPVQQNNTRAATPVQKMQKGGTVGGQQSSSRSSTSSILATKGSQRNSNSFVKFGTNVKLQRTLLRKDNINKRNFADVVDKLKEAQGLVVVDAGSTATTATTTTTTATTTTGQIGPKSKVTGGNLPSQSSINSYAGWREDPFSQRRKYHKGVDVSAGAGTPVSSAQNADVIHAGDLGDGYGYSVVLKHDNGAETRYGHFESINVTKGQKIKAGQLLGREGSTGRSTGPHVHFEHYPNGGAMTYRGENRRPSQVMDSYFRFGGNVKPTPQGGLGLMPVRLNNSIGEDMSEGENSTVALQRIFVIKKQVVPMPLPLG
jgi:murein DD-endopeptidase MepM/ murein hydrolase activator NlpD